MPVLTGTLDTSVNGPEGLPLFDGDAWESTDWRRHEEQVRRLRGRIFKAVQDGDWPQARNLQKLMLRSWGNVLVSVRQVTQRNTGRLTAGIDGLVALTSQARAEMAVRVHATTGSHKPSPVRRVHIPKASDKTRMRPLGLQHPDLHHRQARLHLPLNLAVAGLQLLPRQAMPARPGRADRLRDLAHQLIRHLGQAAITGQPRLFGGLHIPAGGLPVHPRLLRHPAQPRTR
jgi:N-terminal domain of reverse transcriptase